MYARAVSLPARLVAQRFVNTDFLASQLLNTQESLGAADERAAALDARISSAEEELCALKTMREDVLAAAEERMARALEHQKRQLSASVLASAEIARRQAVAQAASEAAVEHSATRAMVCEALKEATSGMAAVLDALLQLLILQQSSDTHASPPCRKSPP